MYGEEHYLSKIERNANVVDKAPDAIKRKCIDNIKWARELSNRLNHLDYDQRDKAIYNIHKVMDEDYVAMGFELKQTENKKR